MAKISDKVKDFRFIQERSDSLDSGVEESDELSDSPLAYGTPNTIKDVAIMLGIFMSLNVSELTHLENQPLYYKKYKNSLNSLVKKVLNENHILFERMIRSLKLTDPNTSEEAISHVAKELFADSNINWGRIVTLYAFVAALAKHGETLFSKKLKPGVYSKKVGTAVGKYIGTELHYWIKKEGGWDKLEAYSRRGDSLESKFFKGVFCTIFGIGILATWKVMR